MVCFIRASELTVGKQYIYYDYMNLDILGTYLDSGDFEYQNPSSLFDLYELSAEEPSVSSNSIPFIEIEAYISKFAESCQIYTATYAYRENFKSELAAKFNEPMAKMAEPTARRQLYNKPPVDPKLLRLREMLKKI